MCGIAGILNQNNRSVSAPILNAMANSISHRGPDGDGSYVNENVGMAHRRLAILDLSSAAQQPMLTADKRYIISYNGEIYNFLEIKIALEKRGVRFNSRSDTEVVLQAFVQWGTAAFAKFNGMFALAIWDNETKTLYLARDRYGIKPLYWSYQNNEFIFGSEIKALLQHPNIKRNICYSALNQYFTFQNIFTEHTLFDGIKILSPASFMVINTNAGDAPKVYSYWDFAIKDNYALSANDTQEHLSFLLAQAVKRQLVADVPVGSYLSGGIDSGAITALASRSTARLTTFTCGFDLTSASGLELNADERHYAEIMANEFKTEHYQVVLHAGDMEYVLPKLIWHLEDLRVGQCYPNFYVARLASKFVKVSLSGTGGDELFAGYPWRYQEGSDNYFLRYYQFWQRLIGDQHKASFFSKDCYAKLAHVNTHDIFQATFSNFQLPLNNSENHINASLYFELKTFLHGLLVVEDKLSMANSLETRVPFLDNDLVDFALKIPLAMKLNGGEGKVILRQATKNLIPPQIVARKKQGFSAPDGSWFKGESINYLNKLLRDPKAKLYEFISPKYVSNILDEHCNGKVNHRLLIWSLLSFECWCRLFLDNNSIGNLDSMDMHLERIRD